MRQSIDDIVAGFELECGTVHGCKYYFRSGLSDNSFWVSPKMRCLMFRIACRQMYEHLRGDRMARKTVVEQPSPKAATWSFIDIKLSDDELEAGLLLWSDADELWDLVVQVMVEGYKVSLTRDEESDSFCASLTGKDCTPDNRSKTITAWFDTASDALRLVLYKHYVVAASGWGAAQTSTKRRG